MHCYPKATSAELSKRSSLGPRDCLTVPEARHFLGLAHYRLRNFSDAIGHLTAALEREEPESAPWKQTVEILGVAYFFEGRWQQAAPLLEQASSWKPHDSELLYTLATTYVRSGRGNQARIPFSKIFQVDPASPEAFALAAELLSQEGRLDDAEALLRERSRSTARPARRRLRAWSHRIAPGRLRKGV